MSSYVFLGGGTPWVYALATELALQGRSVTVLSPYDAKNYVRLRPRWPDGEPPATMRRAHWVLPPGYVGVMAPVFAPVLRWRLARARAAASADGAPWVISPYPWFHRAVRGVPDERLIYYNLDDYPLYNPPRAALIQRQEDEMLRRAALTICLSRHQVETLRARGSGGSGGAHPALPVGRGGELPQSPPGPRAHGADGRLRRQPHRPGGLAAGRRNCARPAGRGIRFRRRPWRVPAAGDGGRTGWRNAPPRSTCPTCAAVGPVRQEDVPGHYGSFGVNWIPYATDHAFNQAACPTKIMDGLASGRPMLSTDVPECRLYPEWITVADTSKEMEGKIRGLLGAADDPGRAARQVEFARGHVWKNRADLLESWLQER